MAKAELYGEEFRDLIQNHGIKCSWQQAIVCDCLTHDSMQPQFNCPKCGGSGYRYLPAKDIRVFVTSFHSRTQQDIMSLRESGTAYATPDIEVIMGFHDRLTFPDFKCKYSERLWVNTDSNVSSKSYRNIKDVVAISHNDILFEKGIDFIISEDGYHVTFSKPISALVDVTEDELVNGMVPISILYFTTPSYLVYDILHELRSHYTNRHVPEETFEEMPKQYIIKREDFMYNVKTEPDHVTKPSEPEVEEPVIDEGGLFD